MDDFEDLLLGGDLETVNNVLARAAAIPLSQSAELGVESAIITESGQVPIPEDIYPKLENVIASCQLRTDLDLKRIAFRVRNAEYNPRKVNAVVIRFRSPRSTCMVYGQGKIMITGARTEEEALAAARKAAKIISKCGYDDAVFTDFRVENLVASSDIRFPVRLEGVAHEHRSTSSYEPELFPGLVYRLFSPKVTLLVFVSGKVVITGARTRSEVRDAFSRIYPVLHKYRK